MKSILKLVCLAAVAFPAALPAQLVVDRQKYPDYDPTVRPDRSPHALRFARSFERRSGSC